MHERFAVVFREAFAEAAGALHVEHDRLLLSGRGNDGSLELEIPFSDLSEVRIGRRSSERLNGYATIILERSSMPPVQIAPLGVALLPEIASLLTLLTPRGDSEVLSVLVPLKPGCLGRVRELLAKGPPIDPASLGLTHEVYLREAEAVFVFRGSNVREQVGKAIRHPAVWQAGLSWQRSFAGPPQIVEPAELCVDAEPAYRWTACPPSRPSRMTAEPTLLAAVPAAAPAPRVPPQAGSRVVVLNARVRRSRLGLPAHRTTGRRSHGRAARSAARTEMQ